MIDFVFVYSRMGIMGGEIESSVRSLRKFFQGEHRIFVVGDNPRIPGVRHIPANRVTDNRFPKALDASRKLELICNYKEISEDFVYMYDDIILLRKATFDDFSVVRAQDHISDPSTYWNGKRKPSSQWTTVFNATINDLKSRKLALWNYETHLPRVFNKENMRILLDEFHLLTQPRMIPTLYFNRFFLAPYETLAENPTVKIGLYEPHIKSWIEKYIPGHLFLNYDNKGYTEDLKKYLKTLLA